jgi:hypothetical protein
MALKHWVDDLILGLSTLNPRLKMDLLPLLPLSKRSMDTLSLSRREEGSRANRRGYAPTEDRNRDVGAGVGQCKKRPARYPKPSRSLCASSLLKEGSADKSATTNRW